MLDIQINILLAYWWFGAYMTASHPKLGVINKEGKFSLSMMINAVFWPLSLTLIALSVPILLLTDRDLDKSERRGD